MAEPATGDPTDDEVEALVRASRAVVAIAVAALDSLNDKVTLPQFRALVALSELGTLRASELADRLGVSASTVTRLADRLAAGRLLRRAENPASRREVLLSITPSGRRLVERVIDHRRALMRQILSQMNVIERDAAVRALDALAVRAAAAVEVHVLAEWPA